MQDTSEKGKESTGFDRLQDRLVYEHEPRKHGEKYLMDDEKRRKEELRMNEEYRYKLDKKKTQELKEEKKRLKLEIIEFEKKGDEINKGRMQDRLELCKAMLRSHEPLPGNELPPKN
jgi:hypothetical protein